MPNIYLGTREGEYSDSYVYGQTNYNHTVAVSNQLFDEHKRFKRVSCSIAYNYDWTKFLKESYYIILYEGENKSNRGKVKFSYYNETSKADQVINQVDIYYPLTNQWDPLAIVLIDSNGKNYIVLYSQLNLGKYIYSYDIGKYLLKGKIKDKLIEEYAKSCKTITFYPTNDTSQNINQIPKYEDEKIYLGKNKVFYLIGFTADSPNGPKLCLDKVFKESKSMKSEASSASGVNCEGVVVYYTSSSKEPLLIECVSESTSKYFLRIGTSDNLQWARLNSTISYKNDGELEKILKFIYLCLENKITVKLDKKQPYDDNKSVSFKVNGQQQIHRNKTLHVTNECKNSFKAPEGYACYKHDLTGYYNKNLKSIIEGLKPDTIFNNIQFELLIQVNNKPVRLFEAARSTKEHLYFQPSSSSDLYVYFWNEQNNMRNQNGGNSLIDIPLLILYGGKGYKPYGTMSNINKWVKVNDIGGYFTESGGGSATKIPKQLLDKIKRKGREQELNKNKSTQTTDSSESEEDTSQERGKDDYRDISTMDGKYAFDQNTHSWESIVGGTLGGILGIGGGMVAMYCLYKKKINVRKLFRMKILK